VVRALLLQNSRPLLKQFPTTGARILVGPGENAGVVDLGDGLRLAFKIESHNHPSAVEPFKELLREWEGFYGISSRWGASHCRVELPALRFPRRCADAAVIHTGVVSGIAHYGNCVGFPQLVAKSTSAYSGNPPVNVMALGLMETEEIKSGADGLGNPVLYVGSTTGRDGMALVLPVRN